MKSTADRNPKGINAFPRDAQDRLVLTDKALHLFWSNVEKRGPDECWEWRGRRTHQNYGRVFLSTPKNYREYQAHRIAYEVVVGRIPNGLVIRHTCDNRACVNPNHLIPGTTQENARDRVLRGRSNRRTGLPPLPGAALPASYHARKTHDRVSFFWSRVKKTTGCWIWMGQTGRAAKGNPRYGMLLVDGKRVGAHRFSYELHYGPIPDGLVVRHECDTPTCVRPDHLKIGTQADNLADMRVRGRAPDTSGDNHRYRIHPESIPRGEMAHSAVRDRYEVMGYIRRYLAGESIADIAATTDTSRERMHSIVLGREWRGVCAELDDLKDAARQKCDREKKSGKVTPDMANTMYALREQGVGYQRIADEVGVSVASAYAHLTGKTYPHPRKPH